MRKAARRRIDGAAGMRYLTLVGKVHGWSHRLRIAEIISLPDALCAPVVLTGAALEQEFICRGTARAGPRWDGLAGLELLWDFLVRGQLLYLQAEYDASAPAPALPSVIPPWIPATPSHPLGLGNWQPDGMWGCIG